MNERALVDAILRSEFHEFVQRCFMTLNPGTPYERNWHIEALAHRLELVRTGKIRRLIVNMPPRSLKSLVSSVAFPAFVLGHDPRKRLIVVSYGSELATKFANDSRAVLRAAWYRRAFPRTRISREKNTEAEVTTTQLGSRMATSVGGTITGRGGGIVVIDDPLKPQDALSESKREAVNEWFSNTLLSRLDDKRTGAIIIVMQRLHVNDLVGKLMRGSDEWRVLNLPAIAEKDEQILIGEQRYHLRKAGDLLHPEREPQAELDYLRKQLGQDVFAAQYQQSPVAPGGNMIKRDWVRRYDDVPGRTPSSIVLQSYDTAPKVGAENSWSVCTTWLIDNGHYYLINVSRGRFDYPTLKKRAIDHARLHKPTKILVEDTGVGSALIPELQNLGFAALPVAPEHNKAIRMSIQSSKFESGLVHLPKQAPWLAELEAELFAFPGSQYDDQVDSISQALAHKIKGPYLSARTMEGYNNLLNGLAFDQYFRRIAGRRY